ncbi:hypothetical protein IA57_00940 [Mangrovimonas yunxiaonensis]|uniref:Uncharacterized protein n=1 Tax=Mangrovimonas yunxiaonensis TaxID=1197477 RepID=A0A084TNE8_9FLAO|nr:MarR family transcriptional regulator [Mangrovimonas yunxiaonensis]KFB02234.1 hypothetical protein IA57_00940 [Mangrovimonas yunxiaonensis]MBR9756566.1 transcriptional regulator [Algicola sp.]GGH39117.1 hypothetical protein GCM10011364_08310 [Mangrovimonas yunxiaonensis]
MTSVITGDIINSTTHDPKVWLAPLKQALQTISGHSRYWEIYRGDSFQVEIQDPLEAFIGAVYIKACIKTVKGLDVRLAIGIGSKTFEGQTVTESNGSAFQASGSVFEQLKKEKINLKISGVGNSYIDDEINLILKLISIPMDHWSANSAEIVKLHLENKNKIQKEIARLIGISQDAVSKRMKRAYLDEVLEVNKMYQKKISQSH